jgi:hypothetical protein
MIVVRDIFRLKFGQSREAVANWKQAVGIMRSSSFSAAKSIRLLTDLAGSPYYTIVLESTFDSLADWEKAHTAARNHSEWKAVYARIIALTETGHREILTVLE